MYKAVFIDIDGTLRDNNRNISSKTIEIISKVTQKGILVILCSGRPRKYTEDISKECNASKYIITSGGANIYDYEKNEIIYINKIDKVACLELYKMAVEADVRFIMNVGESRVVNKLRHLDGSEIELKTDIEKFINENDIMQCVIADSDFEKIRSLKEKIEKIEKVEIKNQHKNLTDTSFPKEGTAYYDVANIESSKGNAIIKFCEKLNIDLKDTIAIGDDYNDISMFKVVGHSVVMGNANDKIKEYADEITESNDNDGVAVFLEKLLKEMEYQKRNGLELIYIEK